jgi:hypothetical protein
MEGGSRERGGRVGEEKRREEVCGGGKAREKEDGKRSESQIFKTEKEEEIVFRMALRKFIYFSQVPWWNRWLGLAFVRRGRAWPDSSWARGVRRVRA